MATPKTAAPAANSPKKKRKRPAPVLPAASAAEKYDPSPDRRALAALIARRGPADPAMAAVFASLLDDPARNALGIKTKGIGVFKDAVDWAVTIDKSLQDVTALVASYYDPVRFAYYLDRVSALDTALVAQEAARTGKGAGRGTVAERETALRKVREDLLFRLERFAGKRKAENEALDAARGRAEDLDVLGKSVVDLVTLGRDWLALPDKAAHTLAASVGLTAALLDATIAAANDLTAAATDDTLAGRDRAADVPEVNVAEGTVLFEMSEAMACFAHGAKRSPLIARLIPGNATRHVLAPTRKPKPAEPQPAAAPAAPAAG
jgi:hypothetical protein